MFACNNITAAVRWIGSLYIYRAAGKAAQGRPGTAGSGQEAARGRLGGGRAAAQRRLGDGGRQDARWAAEGGFFIIGRQRQTFAASISVEK